MTEKNKILIIQNFILLSVTASLSLLRITKSIHPDTSWLTSCAQRLYDGISLIQGCYDTNPPLSTLIYIPAVVLTELTSLQIYYSVYLTIFLLIFVSCLCAHLIIKNMPFLSKEEQFVFMAAYTAATVISPQYDFSQRDHLIAVTAIPFFLVQVAITKKITVPPLVKHIVLSLGTLMIMVKPHYGLLPALLIAHRIYAQKRLSVVFASDFAYLAAGSAIYAATLYIFFPDFIFTILPDIINYYLPYNNPEDVRLFLTPYLLPVALLGTVTVISVKNNPDKRFFYSICWLGTICGLLAFTIQGKGFYYQTIPAKTFFLISCSLSCFSGANYLLKNKDNSRILLPVSFLLIIALPVYKSWIFMTQYTTHSDLLNAPLTRFIKAECGTPCSFFMTYPNMSVNMQTNFYLADSYASRFPAFWFYPVMEYHFGIPPNVMNSQPYQKRLQADKERFSQYVVEDMTKHRPKLLMIYQEETESSDMHFSYFEYFSKNNNFNALAKDYEKIGTFEADRNYYFKGTSLDFPYILRWDVYKLKERKKAP